MKMLEWASQKQKTVALRDCLLCPRQESNPQPTDPKSGALSIELLRHEQNYTTVYPQRKAA